jgi:putative Mg2+ transporter-C (MgtC) family protein
VLSVLALDTGKFMGESWALQVLIGLQAALAGIFGSIVGFERGRSGKGVGLRTHALVAMASSAAVSIGSVLVDGAATGDHSRTLHAVITGVGFIGAGAILHTPNGTLGVTTATSVFLVAVIGASVGVGLPVLAAILTAGALDILRVVGHLQGRGTQPPENNS